MKCRSLFRKGHRATNSRRVYIREHPQRIRLLKSLLGVKVEEVARVGSSYLVVADGESRGFVFLTNEDRADLITSFGDGFVPDAAIQKTLDVIYKRDPEDKYYRHG